ncbi:hypothetical protein TNCV_4076681 [Trichonephila clavipes]|nr:hypothetical protein TNCV_4076681 [Trichonephila clavipes]
MELLVSCVACKRQKTSSCRSQHDASQKGKMPSLIVLKSKRWENLLMPKKKICDTCRTVQMSQIVNELFDVLYFVSHFTTGICV